jgi:hypothetical protein
MKIPGFGFRSLRESLLIIRRRWGDSTTQTTEFLLCDSDRLKPPTPESSVSFGIYTDPAKTSSTISFLIRSRGLAV